MAVDAQLGAIIGGCVAGAVVLIAITAVIVCVCCGKRRQKKDREQKKFQHLTPHTSPSHSQPSTLGHGGDPLAPDPRLPKVGSNGLWMGTPGIYAGTPSPAYYYGRPSSHPSSHPNHLLMQPGMLQRASSETRLPQRVPGGPGFYASGGSQQRIYHSQQLASLTPLYEVVDPRNGSVYDVYQIGGGSKTKLLQDSGGKSGDRHSKSGKKEHRNHSDAVQDPVTKRHHRHKHSQEGHRSSKTGSITKETAQVHEPKDKTTDGKEVGEVNAAFIGSSQNISEAKDQAKDQAVASATDSMKLLAKNKTDDQKKVVNPSSSSETGSKQPSPAPTPIPVPDPDPNLHYTYGGDIYAVPDKEEAKHRSQSENPILARMQNMVLEREGWERSDPVTDLIETQEPLIGSHVYGNSDQGASLIQNPIYQEAEEVVGSEREGVSGSDLVRTQSQDITRQVAAAVRSAADELDSGAQTAGDHAGMSNDVAAASSAVTSLKDAGASGAEEQQRGGTSAVKESLEPRWSVDTDAATDEISRAGKHISVTAEAFEFLDTYLSDEDGGDVQSPPKSPMLSGREEMMY